MPTMTNTNTLNTQQLPKNIFRAYDIRGEMDVTLSSELATLLGQAFASFVAEKTENPHPVIVTARDGRESSPVLSEALVAGLTDAGAQVKDCDMGPTPLCYFAAERLAAEGAIMVTGSHNPPTHNGFKMVCGGNPVYGDDVMALYTRMLNGHVATGQNGGCENVSLTDMYLDKLTSTLRPGGRTLKAVWDPGNGAAGDICQRLAANLPGEHVVINGEVDGTFPNHHPDPTLPENLVQLTHEVQKTGADVGLAFDGDGDRLGVVDQDGTIIWADQLLALLARPVLAKHPGATIVADVKTSQVLFDDVAAHGGTPLMWKTGHSLIKAKMKETGAPLAGEMSGHIFFADDYDGFDDGLYAAVRLLDVLAHQEKSLKQLRQELPATLNTPEVRVVCPEGEKFNLISRLSTAAVQNADLEVNSTDGIRAKFRDGWWLARASNTQEALSIRCEAQTEETLQALKEMVAEYLAKEGVEVRF